MKSNSTGLTLVPSKHVANRFHFYLINDAHEASHFANEPALHNEANDGNLLMFRFIAPPALLLSYKIVLPLKEAHVSIFFVEMP